MIEDRTVAGKMLAEKLNKIVSNPIVLAVPRGGVIVGHEIAIKLGCPLDVIIAKKITPPDNPEYAIGAIVHDGTLYKGPNWEYYSSTNDFAKEIENKKIEVIRRLEIYRGNADYALDKKTVILVDDGIATGATIFAILNWLKKMRPREIILAIPVIPQSTFEVLQNHTQRIIFLEKPVDFVAVGQFFNNFEQVSDNEVKIILSKYR
ncbi:MAG: phosphoribosyltransferase [Crenarchaeota archaeon]|nr:MAG: phosphoribosyltransferase [Thermoproteota archaeon]RDJ34575.1 MAG: phosphoribosyltransferase [Thermoproteota archaeon]RDJ35905.1 MAG: phosphoribosyltransferase [Thermoproteota archaeon]RDJ38482.1 MAG: phosphoribosyltransferase [Thermoproteota archaeon]